MVRVALTLALSGVLCVSLGGCVASTETPETPLETPAPGAVDGVDDVLTRWSAGYYNEDALFPEPPEPVAEHEVVEDPEPDVRASMTSVPCEGEERAPDTGDLGRWADRWYVAHDWTDAGQLIVTLDVGDVVEVDGVKLRVTGVIERLKTVDAPGVRKSFESETLLQTCADDDTNFFAVCETVD